MRHVCFISLTSSLFIQLHIYLTYLWSFYVSTPWPALNFQTSSHKSDMPFFPLCFPEWKVSSSHCISHLSRSSLFFSLLSRTFLKRWSCTTYTSLKRLKQTQERKENMALKFLKCKITLYSGLHLKCGLLQWEQLFSNIDFPQTHLFIALPINLSQHILDYMPCCEPGHFSSSHSICQLPLRYRHGIQGKMGRKEFVITARARTLKSHPCILVLWKSNDFYIEFPPGDRIASS